MEFEFVLIVLFGILFSIFLLRDYRYMNWINILVGILDVVFWFKFYNIVVKNYFDLLCI